MGGRETGCLRCECKLQRGGDVLEGPPLNNPCAIPLLPQVREIMTSPLLPRLLQDAYGNYVVQSVLSVHLAAPVPSSAPPPTAPVAPAADGDSASQPSEDVGAGGDGPEGTAAGAGSGAGPGALTGAGSGGVVMMTTASLHQYAVEAIRPHIALLRATPHGKRILQHIGGKA